MIKVLAIGNSFSEDATALIQLLTDKIFVRNLYIGGCSLERHCNNIDNNAEEYIYEENGASSLPQRVSIKFALAQEEWDYITIQQVSGLSGIYDTYYPYIDKIISYIRENTKAKIIFHQTWSYASDSIHSDFFRYNSDSEYMWQQIKLVSEKICQEQALPVIKCGELITNLRNNQCFDIKNGGISLNRDGFHMSLNYGRIATASLWIKYFTGCLPKIFDNKNLSKNMQIIKKELLQIE